MRESLQHGLARILGVLVAACGAVACVWGASLSWRGVWPYAFGEPFDLIAGGATVTLAGLWLFDYRGAIRRRLLFRGLPEVEMFPREDATKVPVKKALDLARADQWIQKSGGATVWRSLGAGVLVALAILAVYASMRIGLSPVISPLLAKLAAWVLIAGGLLGYLFWSYRKAAPQALRRQLREQGVPLCQACGYDLRGTTLPRCPECGTLIEGVAGESTNSSALQPVREDGPDGGDRSNGVHA